jgi:hypothetical protein
VAHFLLLFFPNLIDGTPLALSNGEDQSTARGQWATYGGHQIERSGES